MLRGRIQRQPCFFDLDDNSSEKNKNNSGTSDVDAKFAVKDEISEIPKG